MSAVEWVAVALGLVNIWLLVRRSIWNYPFGIATVVLQGWLFLEAKLYSDMLLQIIFVALNIYGWVSWAWATGEQGLPVRWMAWRGVAATAVGVILVTVGWGWFMHRYTDAAHPWWDAAVVMMSLAAQGLLARRFIDNWIWWVLVDVAAVPLYWVKGLPLLAGLYVVFLILSLMGLLSWIRAHRAGEVPA